ncbi:hypothetical protein [Streptosporangium subroseum]|uniref:hypothetical protein n=1 Tax=Streptosporangium subroseum TaxID=106412 RepID=UPI00117FDD58|nr:hypothetical protein [Streptosporangium subroseum]
MKVRAVGAGRFTRPFNALTIMKNTEYVHGLDGAAGLVEAANPVTQAPENAEVGSVVLRRRG